MDAQAATLAVLVVDNYLEFWFGCCFHKTRRFFAITAQNDKKCVILRVPKDLVVKDYEYLPTAGGVLPSPTL